MSLGYDDVIERMLAMVEAHPIMGDLDSLVAVRDLHGRVRLAVCGNEDKADRDDLDQKLGAALGGWYGGSLLSTSDGPSKQLAQHVVDLGEPWPAHWPTEFEDVTGGRTPITAHKWKHIQRVLAKEGWLGSQTASPPWPLVPNTPTIVAFYSFKGGVGRSTALGIGAWRLSKPAPDGPGKKVVVIDLDLEAPGLDGLFGLHAFERGVLDWLLETAVGQAPKLLNVGTAPDFAVGVDVLGHQVTVIPAGKTAGASYLEKLARLDYHASASSNVSPVQEGLHSLLKAVKTELSPDYILLDARAGFHDLGGLSLTSLAHVDVIVARHTAATEPGLRLTIDMLKRRRPIQDQLLVVAQSFASHASSAGIEPIDRKKFREWVDGMLVGAPPPVCLEENAQIAQGFTLGDIPKVTLEGAAGYEELVTRIQTLATPGSAGGTP